MQFRSVADLRRDIISNLHRLPKDIDVIVGIPRSGMLPASILALDLNLPMADLRSFSEGRLMDTGSTRKIERMARSFDHIRHALVIDDSISTGGSMASARELLAPLHGKMKITYAAVYGLGSADESADVVFATVPHPRCFEWNIMHHHWVLENACLDIDGVLCHDPSVEENDDGDAYLKFLLGARPLSVPTVKVSTLVTSRLEKYRHETETWLKANGVDYDRLVMLDVATAEERRALGLHGKFKGEYYRRSDAHLFIESELGQAERIAAISGKPVLSIEGRIMCYPGSLSPRAIQQKVKKKLRPAVKRRLKKLLPAKVVALLGW